MHGSSKPPILLPLPFPSFPLWSWNESEDHLKDRSRSPWDDVSPRPSHGDKRNALRRTMIERGLVDAFGQKLKRATINSLLKFVAYIAP